MEQKAYSDVQIQRTDPKKPDPRYVREFHKDGKDYTRAGTGEGTIYERAYQPIIEMSGEDNEDGTATVTLTVTNWFGRAVTDAYLLRLWLSGSALGAPADPGNIAATTGRILVEEVTDAVFTLSTNASGVAVLTLTASVNGTVYVHAALGGGKITVGAIAITGNT